MIETTTFSVFEANLSNAPAGLVGVLGVQIIDPTTQTVVYHRTIENITEFPANSGFYTTQLPAPAKVGDYNVLWDGGTISPETTSTEALRVTVRSGTLHDIPITATDIRILVPRVRRAIEGVGDGTLTDDQVRDITADAIADIILYTGGLWGKDLLITRTDSDIPSEYATSEALTLPEGSVVAAQAALSVITRELSTSKTSETISDEGQTWSYTLSAQALTQRLADIRDARDRALEAIERKHYVPTSFTSLLAERDHAIAGLIEPASGIGYR